MRLGYWDFPAKRSTHGALSRSRTDKPRKRSSRQRFVCVYAEDPEFGYRFIADELRGHGVQISEHRVWRLCSLAQVFSVIARRKPRGKKTGAPVHDDLLQRYFHADRANIVWVIDSTEHWIGEGKLYLCAMKDLYSRTIVGCAMSSWMKSRLAVEALEDAMRKRGFPRGVLVHSDRGSQFASRKFRTALKAYGAKGSMGRSVWG